MDNILEGKVVLITGGTGSFGNKFIEMALNLYKAAKVIVFSRDEWKQSEMKARFADNRFRTFLGDVRDRDRLNRAFRKVDIVIHAAALKQVPMLEYNPFEAVQTNVLGSQNVINAAIDQNVERVVALSTDKAVNPVNLYGATKLCAEKLFVDGNTYASDVATRFSVVRYGNVVGSRGSVIPLFLRNRAMGILPITHLDMTRFWITLEQSVGLVLLALREMEGGEIFVPKIPSMRVVDLAKAIAPECQLKTVGIRPGEKMHEVLISEEEAQHTLDKGNHFVIQPLFRYWGNGHTNGGKSMPADFRYRSDCNKDWLAGEQLSNIVEKFSAVS